MRLRVVGAFIAAVLLLTTGAAQAPEPKLRIVSPPDGDYAVRDVIIRPLLDPPSTPVERMTFFADGRLVCTIERPPFECAWNAGDQVRPHSFRVVAYLPGGRKLPATVTTKGLEVTEMIDVDVVHVTVSVIDGSKFVRGLKRNAFRVYEDDVRQEITYFASENIPLELISAVDISESMTDSIREVKENVKRFLSALRPTDRVTVVGFNENFFVLAPPTLDPAARLKAVDRLASWGMTSLHDILIRSFDLLGRQPGRRALVVFTDGQDTASRVPREAVERREETSDAVLYMIGQGDAIKSVSLKTLCERLAQKSGGRAFFPRTMDDLRTAFDQVLDELSNQYLIGYVPPSPKRDSTWHRIRVEVEGHDQVRAKQGYRFRMQGHS